MKLLSEAFDTVKRVYAYEKSVKADTATLQKIMAVFAIVMILIDVENIRLGKYIIGAATFFVAAVSLVAVWALDYAGLRQLFCWFLLCQLYSWEPMMDFLYYGIFCFLLLHLFYWE